MMTELQNIPVKNVISTSTQNFISEHTMKAAILFLVFIVIKISRHVSTWSYIPITIIQTYWEKTIWGEFRRKGLPKDSLVTISVCVETATNGLQDWPNTKLDVPCSKTKQELILVNHYHEIMADVIYTVYYIAPFQFNTILIF